MRTVRLALGLAVAVSAMGASGADIVVFGQPPDSPIFAALKAQGLSARPIDSAALEQVDRTEARLVIIAGDTLSPPGSRLALTRLLASKRHIIVVGKGAFDYAPSPVRPVTAVNFADDRAYRITQPQASGPNARFVQEPARVSKIVGPDGGAGLHFRTYLRGMGDLNVEFPLESVRTAARKVVVFWAKGDAYADLLALEFADISGKRWLHFLPLTGEWKQYTVSLADFVPQGWSDPHEPYPLLDPATVARLTVGIDSATIWREKPMQLAIAGLSLAENAGPYYAPTSAARALRLPYEERKTAAPAWLFDPFWLSDRIDLTRGSVIIADGEPVNGLANAWTCPSPQRLHPTTRMGTDHLASMNTIRDREQRRQTLWRAAGQGCDGEIVGELRSHAGGAIAGSSIGLFGIPAAEVAGSKQLRDSVARCAAYILRQPKIAAVTVNTSAGPDMERVVPTLRVQLHNPLARAVRGRVVARVGEMQGEAEVSVTAEATVDCVVKLTPVPENFGYSRFEWQVSFETPDGTDVFRDEVDTERGLLRALAHLVRTQRQFPDGRISHHYFGDAYGVRALFAYLDLVKREPERLGRNPDLWAATSADALRSCGLRFVDMLLERQNEDGSIPMGYGEQSHTYNVADGGQIALSLGQVAPLLDPVRREACWQFCRKFAAWAESFYIDELLAQKLMAEHPPAKHPQAKMGHYGLGSSRGVRNALGPYWVLPDILGVQTLLTQVDRNPDYKLVAERNIRSYLDSDYPAAGYFHAEALTWAWRSAADETLRSRITETLRRTFLPPLVSGKEDDMFELGSRGTLRALSMIYCRRFVGDSPGLRAALLKYVWAFGAESSERSMRRFAEAYPKPHHGESIAASKYASFSAIWAMELLEEGSSFLRGAGGGRGHPGLPASSAGAESSGKVAPAGGGRSR